MLHQVPSLKELFSYQSGMPQLLQYYQWTNIIRYFLLYDSNLFTMQRVKGNKKFREHTTRTSDLIKERNNCIN